MFPRLLELGPITLYSYGLLLALGYLAGLRLALIRARARGLNGDRVMDLGIWIIVSALVGAKLLLLYQDWRLFSSDPKQLLSLAQSGGVFYGGLILAVIVALWYIRRHKLPMWTTTDVFAPGIALGHVIGRIGCFLAGCCYGKETTVPWSVVFTDPFALANAGTPLNVAPAPDAALRVGRRGADPGRPAVLREARPRLPRPHVLGLHAGLRGVAVRHRVLPRRSRPRPLLRRRRLAVADHLDRAGAAQPGDAVVAVAAAGAGRATWRAARKLA